MKIARFPNGSPEVFRTLQGEGPSMGFPAIFIRLSLCNLHCTWCDTPFTWNWEGTPWEHQDPIKYSKSEQILEQSVPELISVLKQAVKGGDHLVITGGEPLLQQTELIELLPLLPKEFAAVEIESNGTQLPKAELDSHVTQYNISPKLSNSGNEANLRLSEKALSFFAQNEKAFFKFVVMKEEDIAEILALQSQFAIPAARILLMPEGRTPSELAKNRNWIAQTCLDHGYRMTDRLHVQLWGDERGR